ncbi:MAG: hypothetical protein A2571_00305 [Candidatus Vogelbacteria bacterium RIFOXYD1_FULL_44_32]|uniref:Resolvase/invertase-type recombinase catalytic domain-containing protein n=1 Tax=Candidatus Vogelbacteria bacterium RIFOXYD1_FULL_44_32 TaxID=1802438 RepID=A0A1G2QDY3_9BACT|nr:MAG: hypothetical protein A2571_00305 [Candidatus Vogelbacteria bacterium RIFOXYD1_FULL_44_32]
MEKKEEKVIRAAAYLRVSTDEQIKGYGLPYQKEKVILYSQFQGYDFDQEKHMYVDEGFSGALPIEKRPALCKLFEAAERGGFDIVLVYRLDRFARKIYETIRGVERLTDNAVDFCSITEPFNTATPHGRYVMQSLAALAELERETIKERTSSGRRMAARENKWIWGTPPYGYDIDPDTKKLIVVKKEAKWVVKFMEWIVDEGMTLTSVQKRANEMGVPCYTKRKRKSKSKKLSGYWHKKTIAKIISNPIFTGTTYFFRFKKQFLGLTSLLDESVQNDKDDWVEFKTEKVVSDELFEACQRQLLKNREFAARNIKNDYLYNKLVICGGCNKKMFASTKNAKKDTQNPFKFYHGARKAKWREVLEVDNRCKSCGQIAETKLNKIWDALGGLFNNPDYVVGNLQAAVKKSGKTISQIYTLIQVKKARLVQVQKKLQRIDEVYVNGTLFKSREEYNKKRLIIKDEEHSLKKEILVFEKELNKDKVDVEKAKKDLVEVYKKISVGFGVATYEQKAAIIHLVVERIIISKDKTIADVQLKVQGPSHFSFSDVIKDSETDGLCKQRANGDYTSPHNKIEQSQLTNTVLCNQRFH